ncbi:helix-turn-helix domain-containing protein [Erythrobacter sp. MTPC3]|uniref:helix-turn-helix domain-containing protein n=1 Tax=Erythrobacter sp. MTPC3 TaxID=3056564 RepID=UPI0036F19724
MVRYLSRDEVASPTLKHLAANCRCLRIARGLSQAELSELSGIAASHISNIENVRANPTIDSLEDLASALQVSVLDLLQER